MRLINLLENNIIDTASKGLSRFVADHKDTNSDLYVVFSDNKYAEFIPSKLDPFKSAMIAYPVNYVIENITLFDNIQSKYIVLIDPVDGGIDVNNISKDKVREVLTSTFLNTANMKYFGNERTELVKSYRNQYGPLYRFHILRDIIQDHSVMAKKIAPFFYDNNGGVLSDKYKKSAMFLHKYTYKYVSHYFNRDEETKSQSSINSNTIRKLAASIASGLGTTLSSDKEVSIFTETVFWTTDGVQINITQLYRAVSQPDLIDNDGVYYIIECNTPNGVVIYDSSPEETFDHIKSEIKSRYSTMNRPSPNWTPKSRDLYLTGTRNASKLFDEEKERYINTTKKLYPAMREFAMRYKIILPEINMFADTDLIILFHVMEQFIAKQPEPLVALKRIRDEGKTISELAGVPHGTTVNIDYSLVEKLALVYLKARKQAPNRNGWHIFKFV